MEQASNWMDSAECKGMPIEIFFDPDIPDGGAPRKGDRWAEAKRICDACAVTDECLRSTLDIETRVKGHWVAGYFGGMPPIKRSKIVRERRRALRA